MHRFLLYPLLITRVIVIGDCPSNGRDCDGTEMSRMRGGGSSRLWNRSPRDPTIKPTGHFRPTLRDRVPFDPSLRRGSSEYHVVEVRHCRHCLMEAKNHAVATRPLLALVLCHAYKLGLTEGQEVVGAKRGGKCIGIYIDDERQSSRPPGPRPAGLAANAPSAASPRFKGSTDPVFTTASCIWSVCRQSTLICRRDRALAPLDGSTGGEPADYGMPIGRPEELL